MITRCLRLFAASILVATVVVLPSSPSQAATPACDGVLVVVDATALGADVTVRCVQGAPKTGLDALTQAGYSYTFVPRIPGMVCQIDQQPNSCNNAPANAYWSYWHQDPSQPWRYATQGAGTFTPAVGSAEGWVFGSGDTPPRIDLAVTADDASVETPQTNGSPSTPPPSGSDTPTANTDAPNDPSEPQPRDNDNTDSTGREENTDGDKPTAGWLANTGIDLRQVVGLLLLLIGIGALITARRNRAQPPGR